MIIDVSEHQGKIDWKKVAKNKNVEAVIIRIGYGQNIQKQDDKRATDNIEGCIKYGIPFGFYIYSYAKTVDTVKGEAEHMLRFAKKYNNKISLPLYYDIEEPGTGAGSRQRYLAYAKIIKAAGYVPGLYTGEYWYNTYISADISDTKWIAKYGTNNGKHQIKPNIKYAYDLWQYTSKAAVDGIAGGVDASVVMNKDWMKSSGTAKAKETKTATVKVRVTAKSGLNCREKASTSAAILGAFTYNSKLTLIEKTSDKWWKVKGKDAAGKTITGYVYKQYVEILS
jgi:lysozyme